MFAQFENEKRVNVQNLSFQTKAQSHSGIFHLLRKKEKTVL